ncbi:MAG: hypothetical protein QHH00_04985 [Methanomassiliicoccales archaeon]|jgi:hypothetical protein|nr:hypothetical protein [Methanomassiliicoccales archaeon]
MTLDRKVVVLCVLAAVNISVLLLITDFSVHTIANFEELPNEKGQRVHLICSIESIRKSENGWILQLSDLFGHEIRAFCEFSLVEEEGLDLQPVVEVIADVGESGDFVFIKSIEPYDLDMVNSPTSLLHHC